VLCNLIQFRWKNQHLLSRLNMPSLHALRRNFAFALIERTSLRRSMDLTDGQLAHYPVLTNSTLLNQALAGLALATSLVKNNKDK